MCSIQFSILPPPAILKNDIECLRIAQHSGEEAIAIKVSPLNLNMTVFYKYSRGCQLYTTTK
jgi:hypothetical protein